jgi:hypothetical protein
MGRWIAGALMALGLIMGAMVASSSADTAQFHEPPMLDSFAGAE